MKRAHQILAALAVLLLPTASAHIGNLDQNGGHYYGNSYHCHMRGCVYPDTFNRFRNERMTTNRQYRERFFNTDDWNFELDFDGDCQSTRQEVLILTSQVPVRFTNPRNCIVRTGQWVDEYTGEVYEVAMQLDVEHVIPLMYAHTHGGDRWSPMTKLQFANDPLNILMVERREAGRKRDRGPSRFLPREEFQCEYVRLWDAIAAKYELFIANRDRNAMDEVLENCAE